MLLRTHSLAIRFPVRECGNPRPEYRAVSALKLRQPRDRVQERFLRHVLSTVAVAQHAEGDADDAVLGVHDQLAHSFLVSLARPRNKLPFTLPLRSGAVDLRGFG